MRAQKLIHRQLLAYGRTLGGLLPRTRKGREKYYQEGIVNAWFERNALETPQQDDDEGDDEEAR